MKKITSLFALMCATTLLFAAEPKVVTIDFTDSNWNLPTDYVKTAASYTYGDYTISFSASSNGHKVGVTKDKNNNITSYDYLIMGKKDALLTLPVLTMDVAKIVVYGRTAASTNVEFNLGVITATDTTMILSTNEKDATKNHDLLIPSQYQKAGTKYAIKIMNAYNMQITKIEMIEVVAGAPDVPTFSLAAGAYNSNQQVTLTCTTEGAKIYYTTDETTPTETSTEYTTPITVDKTTTIKAIAIKDGISSEVAIAKYVIATIQGKGTKDAPFTVKDVQTLTASYADKCWVEGYILGVSGSSNSGAFAFTNTIAVSNLVIADVANEEEPANAIPVELKNGSDARTQLNIKDNSANIGKKVKLYGTLESYFSTVGVKNIEEFELEGSGNPTGLDAVETLNINAPMYNLMGQQVTADYKGIVLQNGQKYLLQ
ncbi:MAG: chitobiase/beta-hexosaminidase C-terminal domain-containing protein [Paludibacteraceae bacterium]|nr:chitobiase/beta-hexosaminidase C-terminal domain-containing protein [Paludibacteraceae bacterium]